MKQKKDKVSVSDWKFAACTNSCCTVPWPQSLAPHKFTQLHYEASQLHRHTEKFSKGSTTRINQMYEKSITSILIQISG